MTQSTEAPDDDPQATTCNPTDDDAPPMLALNEGIVDSQQLIELVHDLENLAELISILEKGSPTSHGSSQTIALRESVQRLTDKAIAAVQIRYVYDSAEWCDTLFPHAQGYRIVRTKLFTSPT